MVKGELLIEMLTILLGRGPAGKQGVKTREQEESPKYLFTKDKKPSKVHGIRKNIVSEFKKTKQQH